MKLLRIVLSIISLTLLTGRMPPAQANCNDFVGRLEWHEPMFTEHFQCLRNQSRYPWGDVPIYDRIDGATIILTANFEQLSGSQKRQALDVLLNLQDYLTPEAYEEQLSTIGRLPHRVVASDGRPVSVVYDGCTRFTLLTEWDRYRWVYVSQGRGVIPSNVPESELRNAGYPDWRQVNFPIDPATEQAVRLGFWNSVGYEQSGGWWIAWVPEHGYFEINVPENYDAERLDQYWQVADRNYRYVLLSQDGSQLTEPLF